MSESDKGILLAGLDGSNPLAFLAAIGTLRMLSLSMPGVTRLRWTEVHGAWRPRLHSDRDLDEDRLIGALTGSLTKDGGGHEASAAWKALFSGDLRVVRGVFQAASQSATSGDRARADWLAAAGSDAIVANQEGLPDSGLRCSRSDYFLGNIREIVEQTSADHLRRALFRSWDYADPSANLSLRLDPLDDKRYAYQWTEPTSDRNRHKSGNMLGANRLALESFVCFPSFAVDGMLATTGLRGHNSRNIFFTWPIWNVAVDVHVAQSLCTHGAVHSDPPAHEILRPMGCSVVYLCQRLTVGRNKCLAPSRAI